MDKARHASLKPAPQADQEHHHRMLALCEQIRWCTGLAEAPGSAQQPPIIREICLECFAAGGQGPAQADLPFLVLLLSDGTLLIYKAFRYSVAPREQARQLSCGPALSVVMLVAIVSQHVLVQPVRSDG